MQDVINIQLNSRSAAAARYRGRSGIDMYIQPVFEFCGHMNVRAAPRALDPSSSSSSFTIAIAMSNVNMCRR